MTLYQSFVINLLFLNLIVFILVYYKMYISGMVSKNFHSMFWMLFLLGIVNLYIIFTKDISVSLSLLVLLSFYSMFLIVIGYGSSYSIMVVLGFKTIADVFIFIFVSSIVLMSINYISPCGLETYQQVSLVSIFIIYSLVGVFGFWIYWGMDASYYISSYIHSCGFISVGVVLFNKLSLEGIISPDSLIFDAISKISFTSFVFFLLFSCCLSDYNKSFGLYSAASICFLFFTSINYPIISFSYFFISSCINILIFDLLYYSNNVNSFWYYMILLSVINILSYSVFFILVSSIDFFIIISILLKTVTLLLFIFNIHISFNSLSFNFIMIGEYNFIQLEALMCIGSFLIYYLFIIFNFIPSFYNNLSLLFNSNVYVFNKIYLFINIFFIQFINDINFDFINNISNNESILFTSSDNEEVFYNISTTSIIFIIFS